MGQTHTSSFSGRRKSIRKSLRSPFPRRSRTNQSLSATFNYVDSDIKSENQLNLNTATAEELMTLPGVTRTIAQNIIEYRHVIGRYNKVEDLALVTGVGAEKLSVIRPEICVHRRKSNSSNQSSRAQSLDSLASSEASLRPPSPVDINAANVFTLMTLQGVSQELAANIVDYRERRGPFNGVEDLLRVRGMSMWLLSNLRNQVVVGPPPPGTPIPVNKKLSLALLNGTSLSRFTDRKPQMNGHVPVNDIFELLCAYSQRPLVDDAFHGTRDGRAALRLASWNLTTMSSDKADNPGVKEVVCRTLLENRFSLVATQEVLDPVAAEKIVSELNQPRLRRVLEWRGKRGKWKSSTTLSASGKRSCGFLYDSDTGITISEVQVICDDETAFAILAKFEFDSANVTMMNIHLAADNIKVRELCQRLLTQSEPDIAIGDFTYYPDAEFIDEGYTRILLSPTVTNSMAPGTSGINLMDNIYLNKRSLSRYTGVSGIIRQGLNHVAIPRGWQWGGPASEHCPVWCELYT